jgi:DNA-binding transcriptional MerR regulator
MDLETKPYYRDLEDTLHDVGISPRQLSYWRQKGLFTPELGDRPKGYTARDTEQLRVLKRLVVDLKLPIETVLMFYAKLEADYGVRRLVFFPFVDLETGELIPREQALTDELDSLDDAGAQEMATLLIFRVFESAAKSKHRRGYEAVKKNLTEKIQRAELAARTRPGFDGLSLNPSLPGDPDLSQEELAELQNEAEELTNGFPFIAFTASRKAHQR